MKRILLILLSISLYFSTLCHHLVLADESKGDENKRLSIIEELYEERSFLCLNYKQNEKAIQLIDKRLSLLGVEELSASDLNNLFVNQSISPDTNGNFKLRHSVSDSATTRWTSTRTTYSHNGTTYELQIITGVNKSGTAGKLYKTWTSVASRNSFVANAVKCIKIILSGAVSTFVLPADLSTGLSVYDVFSDVISSLNPTTTINDFQCTYVGTINASIKYVFVKIYGQPDGYDYQKLCYYGNSLAYESLEITGAMVAANGTDLLPGSGVNRDLYYTIKSNAYTNPKLLACINYESMISSPNVQVDYDIRFVKEQYVNGTKKNISVPTDAPEVN